MTVKIAPILLSFICVALISDANAAEVEPLASLSQTVIADGNPIPTKKFNVFARSAGIPRSSRQDTLRELNVGHKDGRLLRSFIVREGGSPKRTDIGLIFGKRGDIAIYLTNPRGDLKWAGRGKEGKGYVATPLGDAREAFARELKFWQGYEEYYHEQKAKTEDGS